MVVTYVYDDETNRVTLSGSGTASYTTLRTLDRSAVKAHKLHPRGYDWEASPYFNGAPTLQVRPLDNIALRLKIEVQNFSVAGILTLTGTDWKGASFSENISITANGIYQTTNYFRTITNIADDGTLTCEWKAWQDPWGLFGYNTAIPNNIYDYTLQGGITVQSGVTFTPASIISRMYSLTLQVNSGDDSWYSYDYDIIADGGTILFGRLYDATKKICGYGVKIDRPTSTRLSAIADILNTGGTIGFYGSTLSNIRILSASVTRLWGAQLGAGTLGLLLYGVGYDFYGCVANKLGTLVDCSVYEFEGTIDRVNIFGASNIVVTWRFLTEDVILDNVYSRGSAQVVWQVPLAGAYSANIIFRNADIDVWNNSFASGWTGKLWRKYGFDAFCEDENGNPLSGVSAVGKYADGSEAFSVVSDANGNIPTQMVDRSWYEYATGNNTENLKVPLKVTYSKAGYQTQIKPYLMAKKTEDTVTMETAVDIILVDETKPALSLNESDPKNEEYLAL